MSPEQPQEINQSILTQEEETALVKKLGEHYTAFQSAASPLHTQIDKWHQLYESFSSEEKTFPWKGASNYRIPLILSVIESYHARVVKSVFEVDPLWITRARTPQGVQSAEKAQWYLDYWADQMDLAKALDVTILNTLIEGTGVVKVDWVRSVSSIPDTPTAPGMEAFQQAASMPTSVIEYEGPEATSVPLKDFILIPADSPTIESATYVGHRVWRTQQQLKATADAGYYWNVDKLFEKSKGDSTNEKTANPSELIEISNGSGNYPETNQYEIVEMYGPYEFDEGVPVPAVMTFSAKHEILLRVEPYPYGYGQPPYIDFTFFPRPNFFFGRSMAHLLESSQEELTGIHNMRMDGLARLVAPPILKKFGSRWDEESDPLSPGAVITVNTPDEIMELALRDVPGSLFAHEQDLMSFVERATGMSDFAMGRMNNQYATATAVNRVTSEGLARVDVAISRFQHGLKKLAWFLWWLLYEYRPFWDYFYAENQQMSITKIEMRPAPNGMMPFEIIPQGMLSDASKDAVRSQKLMMFQMLSAPLQQFYPDGLQVLMDDVLKAHDVMNRADIIGPSWNLIQQQMQQAMQAGAEQALAGQAKEGG